jgi:hypothetical protein
MPIFDIINIVDKKGRQKEKTIIGRDTTVVKAIDNDARNLASIVKTNFIFSVPLQNRQKNYRFSLIIDA